MELSNSFSIDPEASWVKRHNEQARQVLEAYYADRPVRVPLLCDESFLQHGPYADEIDLDYRVYYTSPDEMLRVQLEAARRRRELPIYDFILGEAPESWPITVDLWPTPAPGWVGCELVYRRDAVIAHRSLRLSKQECLELPMPDPQTGGILKTYRQFWDHLRERYEGKLTFLGRPVGPVSHGVHHAGFFALALDVRGPDIMLDMIEDPEFARAFLLKMGEWCDTLERTWATLAGNEVGHFSFTDHGIDMLSPALYEQFIESSSAVQAVCSWCSPTDLAWVGVDPNPGVGMVELVSDVVGGPLADNLDLARQASLYSPKAVSRGINSSTAICAVACKIIPRIRLCL